MSRCKSCDKKLTDIELRRKIIYPDGKWEYLDMCSYCSSMSDNSVYKIKDVNSNYVGEDLEED